MTLAVVIPALNEAGALASTLAAVRAAGSVEELVVVDGGSGDGTAEVARAAGATVLGSRRGRGIQLAAGISATRSEAVVLLHADTHPAPGAWAAVREALADPGVAGGGFEKGFRDGPALLRFGAVARSRLFFALTGRLFGDQAVFLRRAALELAGGMPEWPLMEEFELCRRLETRGRLVLVGPPVRTSGRRFERRGTVGTWWMMARVLWGYWRGRAPEELLRIYR